VQPETIAAVAGAVTVVVVVVFAISRRGRSAEIGEGDRHHGREPINRHEVDERRREALERSGLPEMLARLEFVRESASHARWRRGPVELTVGFRDHRPPEPAQVDRCDIRIAGTDGERFALARDFVGRAKRSRAGELETSADVEHDGVRKSAASDADGERFRALLARHADVLRAVGCSTVELYHHRSPKLHVYVDARDEGCAELVSRAVDCATTMWTELHGEALPRTGDAR
jgi:hypothetical protein